MSVEEQQKSKLYFIYLRYCESNPKDFNELSINDLITLIEEFKKNAS